jgi:hypothetical protein
MTAAYKETCEHDGYCKTCYRRWWLTNNRERVNAYTRKWRATWRYGLSLSEWDALYLKQDGRCAVCRAEFTERPHTDHNHTTGKVRGLLCRSCNHAIGFMSDQPERLRQAARYLEEHDGV